MKNKKNRDFYSTRAIHATENERKKIVWPNDEQKCKMHSQRLTDSARIFCIMHFKST